MPRIESPQQDEQQGGNKLLHGVFLDCREDNNGLGMPGPFLPIFSKTLTHMDVTRLFDFVDYQLSKYPQDKALCDLFEGRLRTYSIGQVQETSNQIAHGLLDLGLRAGDKVAIVILPQPSRVYPT